VRSVAVAGTHASGQPRRPSASRGSVTRAGCVESRRARSHVRGRESRRAFSNHVHCLAVRPGAQRSETYSSRTQSSAKSGQRWRAIECCYRLSTRERLSCTFAASPAATFP
jgi:hypothetical protein